jgi:hypothetical protein
MEMKIRWPLIAMAFLVTGAAPGLSSCVARGQTTYVETAAPGYPSEWEAPRHHVRGRPGTHRHGHRDNHH